MYVQIMQMKGYIMNMQMENKDRKEPILVVMAAGIGSRYGGLKQTDPVGSHGELIIDYSVYDAVRAGFKKVVFIINHKIEKDFKEIIGDRLTKFLQVEYAFQELEDVPEGIELPKDRVKPLGTAHAIYAARKVIDAPFAVINADDYYGVDAFSTMYTYLCNISKREKNNHYEYAMVGYRLGNTVTENGYVSRGVCNVDKESNLLRVEERVHIETKEEGIMYLEEGVFHPLAEETIVSMNMWGLQPSLVKRIEATMFAFLEKGMKENPLKCEYFLPFVVDDMIQTNMCSVKVLPTEEKWYGVTYSEDKEAVVCAIENMVKEGKYPQKLWEEK